MALIHILDKQRDEIIGTLNSEKGQVNEPLLNSSIENFNKFDMRAYTQFDKLTKRNRLLVQNADGFFEEFIITYADQYKRHEKEVKAMGSFVDLQTAKVIDPQNVGDTPIVCVTFALNGTEWKPGKVDYTGSLRNINVEDHTDPYNLLKLIASTFELEIRYRVEVDGNRIVGRYVDMVEQIAGFEGKEITFGKDLIGIRRVENSMNIVTALVGLGPTKEDGTRLEVYVEDKEALARWGRNGRHLVRVYEPQSDDAEMTLERLTTLTENELEKRIDAVVTYECEAVSLENVFGRSHEKIRLGQTIRIKDDGYNPPLYLEARIRETTENIATRAIIGFKIGNFIEYSKADLEKQVAALKKQMAQKVDDARLRYEISQTEKVILVQDTPPDDPVVGQKYIDTSGDYYVLKEFDGTKFNETGPTKASEIGGVEMNVKHTNGLLWSDILGLIVERSDGNMRAAMSGTDGFYIEQRVGSSWVKVFWVDAEGNGVFSGIVTGAEINSSVIKLLNSGSFKATTEIANQNDTSFLIEDGLFKGSIGKQTAFFGWLDGDSETYKGFSGDVAGGFVQLVVGNGTLDDGITPAGLGGLAVGELRADLLTMSQHVKPFVHSLLTLQNGWSNYGATFATAAYTKTIDGYVHLRGLVKGGTLNSVIGTLPVGCRPVGTEIFTVMDGTNNAARVDINAVGAITLLKGNTTFISLSSISFKAEN